jgi:hypothetical protein
MEATPTTPAELLAVWPAATTLHNWPDSFMLVVEDDPHMEVVITRSEVTEDGYLGGVYLYTDIGTGEGRVMFVELAPDEIGPFVDLVAPEGTFAEAEAAVRSVYGNRVDDEVL